MMDYTTAANNRLLIKKRNTIYHLDIGNETGIGIKTEYPMYTGL